MSRIQNSLKDLAHRLAAERGGKMLSSEYVNAQCKLLWQCEHGHKWEALLKVIKKENSWCPRCSKDKRKLSIDDIHRIAAERGEKMLFSEYVNIMCQLRWECEHGHQWKASLSNVKYGRTWCPHCRKPKR